MRKGYRRHSGDARSRLLAKIRETATGCWEWTGFVDSDGYGHFNVRGERDTLAHRWAYALLIGPIAEGLEIDHLCRNRGCVNPAHLEAVSHRVNSRRGQIGLVAAEIQRSKTHCINGHPFTEDNTYVCREGWRRCRTCNAAAVRRNYERRRQDGA